MSIYTPVGHCREATLSGPLCPLPVIDSGPRLRGFQSRTRWTGADPSPSPSSGARFPRSSEPGFPGSDYMCAERRKALPGGVGDSALQSVAEVEGCFQRLPAVGVGQGLGDDRVQRCFEVPPEAACHSSAAPIRSIR